MTDKIERIFGETPESPEKKSLEVEEKSATSKIEEDLNSVGTNFVKSYLITRPFNVEIFTDGRGKDFMRDVGKQPEQLGFKLAVTKPFADFQRVIGKVAKTLSAFEVTYNEDIVCFGVKRTSIQPGTVKQRKKVALNTLGESYFTVTSGQDSYYLYLPFRLFTDEKYLLHVLGFAILITNLGDAGVLVDRAVGFYYMEMANIMRFQEFERMSEKDKERMQKSMERKSKIRKDPAQEEAEQLKEVQIFYKSEHFPDFAAKYLAYSFVACYNGKAFELSDDKEFTSLTEYYVNNYTAGKAQASRNWLKVQGEMAIFFSMEDELRRSITKFCPKGSLTWKYLQQHFGLLALATNNVLTPSMRTGALNSAKSMVQNIWWPFSNTVDFCRAYCRQAYNSNYNELYKGLHVLYDSNEVEITVSDSSTVVNYYMTITTVKKIVDKSIADLEPSEIYRLYLLCGLNTIQLQKYSELDPEGYVNYVRAFCTVQNFKHFLVLNYSKGRIDSLKDFNRTIAKCNLSLKTFCKDSYKVSMKTPEGRAAMLGAFEKTSEKAKREAASKVLFAKLAKELFPVEVVKPKIPESGFKKPEVSGKKEVTLDKSEVF